MQDVAEKLLSFAQQRPRALCIMSGNGTVSVVELHQFATSDGTITYEVRIFVSCGLVAYIILLNVMS